MARKLIVVDDAEVCGTLLEVALIALPDVEIHAASTAEEALLLLARGGVCALITDLHLPRMDGFELIERVRRLPGHAVLPIVVISGDSDPRTPARVLRLGANAFFPKPYSPLEVRQKLEQLIHAP
jgi:CheY-like chemotaxis protein